MKTDTVQEKRASRFVMEGRRAASAGKTSRDCPYRSSQPTKRGRLDAGLRPHAHRHGEAMSITRVRAGEVWVPLS